MNGERFLQRLMVVVIMVGLISGCKHDPVLGELKNLKEKVKTRRLSVEEQHINLAISEWQNHVVDKTPILITSYIGKPTGYEQKYLSLIIFDEDKDIVGFGIKEQHADPNGLTKKTTLTEEYPAFVHRMFPEVLTLRVVPVQTRNSDQTKNTRQWDEYIEGKGINLNEVRNVNHWRETLPPVWISIPEPNMCDVYVYVYDQMGHKSDSIELRVGSALEE